MPSGVLRPDNAWVAELVDARDLKSLEASPRAGSIPALGTRIIRGLARWGRPSFFGEAIAGWSASLLPNGPKDGQSTTAIRLEPGEGANSKIRKGKGNAAGGRPAVPPSRKPGSLRETRAGAPKISSVARRQDHYAPARPAVNPAGPVPSVSIPSRKFSDWWNRDVVAQKLEGQVSIPSREFSDWWSPGSGKVSSLIPRFNPFQGILGLVVELVPFFEFVKAVVSIPSREFSDWCEEGAEAEEGEEEGVSIPSREFSDWCFTGLGNVFAALVEFQSLPGNSRIGAKGASNP